MITEYYNIYCHFLRACSCIKFQIVNLLESGIFYFHVHYMEDDYDAPHSIWSDSINVILQPHKKSNLA